MKAEYVADSAHPGYAELRIDGAGGIGSPANPRCVIKRSSDGKSLGRGGWDRAEHDLPYRDSRIEDDCLVLYIGPEVVDELDALEGYRLALRGSDGREFVCALTLSGIVYSPQTGVRGLAEVPEEAPATARDKGAAEPAPAQADDEVVLLDVVAPQETPEAVAPYEAIPPLPERPAGRKSSAPLIAVLVLFLVVGGAAVLKMRSDENGNGAPPAQQPLADQAAPRVESTATGEGQDSGAPDPAPDKSGEANRVGPASALGRARGHLAGRADPVVGFELYRQLRTEENGADAAFLLAEDAAQKGLPEAMIVVAGYYDPLLAGDCGSIKKDAEEAFNWYTKAEQAGVAEAASRLAALKERVAAEAAGGNREAERLLKRFSR
ncbi:MAG: hypothetical protein LBQ51_09850 [Desulfovibrio sp.]|nr:hypothetical protein [Desulfovibrio sp.]